VRRTVLLIFLAGLPATAHAQPGDATYIDIKVRAYGTSDPFVDHLSFIHPDLSPAEIEVGLFYFRESGIGLATVVHNIVGAPFSAALGDAVQVLDNNPTSTLHPDGRIGNFNFGGQFQVIYHTGTGGVDANRFRIAATGNAGDALAGGVSIKQNTPVALGTNFDTADGIFGYHFKLTMACATDGSSRTMTIDAPRDRINLFTAYGGVGDPPPPLNVLDSDFATIRITAPAPASLASITLAALTLSRRRRV